MRVGSTKNVLKKLNVDEINFNKGLDENQRIQLAGRMRECIESDILHLEVYYMNDAKECAQEIISELQNIFQNTDNMTFTIKMCELGNLGAALESSKSAAVLKRMKEIEKKSRLHQKLQPALYYCLERKAMVRKILKMQSAVDLH